MERLEHARVAGRLAEAVCGHVHAGSTESLPRRVFVVRRADGFRRMKAKFQTLRDFSGYHCRLVPYGDDSVERPATCQRLNPGIGLLELHGRGLIAPRVFENVASVRHQGEFNAEAPGRAVEFADLITGFGGD